MTTFFIYLARVIVCSALFAGCYWLLLRNTRLFHWNRFYILTSVALSVIIPLLEIQIPMSYVVVPPAIVDYVFYFANATANVATTSVQPEATSVSWIWLGFSAYLSVVLFLLAREVLSFARLIRLKRHSERMHTSETVLYCINDASAPFAFFRSVFWKKDIPVDSDESRCMIRHELAHVRLGHSWDKAMMQFVCCMFWMNPFFILFRRELELVHEFAADSESASEEFSSILLCMLYPKNYHDFVSHFFQSPIKRRIFMITKNKKTSMNMLRKMSIVPVALVAMYLFACNSGNENLIKSGNEEQILTLEEVDAKPMFDGNYADIGFREFVNRNVVYPPEAQKMGISGRVIVEFDVETDGSITNVNILHGADPLLDAEALRVINSSPKWSPAKHNGKTVKVRVKFPFVFMLQ